ncbi:Peptide-binding protein [Pararobbsia alpina]|jgi:hypothetical protein|uniref:hypothetical protein n=1 Tax=Pararobbsia alpina TaxID=621374 RepID=UPI0039A5A16F
MNAKKLLAVGVAALQLGGFLMASPARSQAASAWASHAAPTTLPVDRAPPRGSDFTPPAPRGNLRGDIAANSHDDRHDHDRNENDHKPARR